MEATTKEQRVWFDGYTKYFDLNDLAKLCHLGYEYKFKESVPQELFYSVLQFAMNKLAVEAIVSGDSVICPKYTGLGKVQVIEHESSSQDADWDNKYAGKDWSIVWKTDDAKTLSRFSPEHKKAVMRRVDRGEVDYMEHFLDEEKILKTLSLLSKISNA